MSVGLGEQGVGLGLDEHGLDPERCDLGGQALHEAFDTELGGAQAVRKSPVEAIPAVEDVHQRTGGPGQQRTAPPGSPPSPPARGWPTAPVSQAVFETCRGMLVMPLVDGNHNSPTSSGGVWHVHDIWGP